MSKYQKAQAIGNGERNKMTDNCIAETQETDITSDNLLIMDTQSSPELIAET